MENSTYFYFFFIFETFPKWESFSSFFYSVEHRVPEIKVVSAQVKHMFRMSFDSMCIKQRITYVWAIENDKFFGSKSEF